MSSDYWQELWREQPVPELMRDPGRFLTHVADVQTEWEREWDKSERVQLWWLWFPAVRFLEAWWSHDPLWMMIGDWTMSAIFLWIAGLTLAFRLRRRRIACDFGPTLIERIALGQALLRQRIRLGDLMLWATPLLAVAIGTVVFDLAGESMRAAAIAVAVATPLIAWAMIAGWRGNRAKLEQQVARFEEMRQQLLQA